MAIDGFLAMQAKPLSPSIIEYIKKGIEFGAYKDSSGWSHGGLVRLAQEYGFQATTQCNVDSVQLGEALKQNCLPIISIKWAFEDYKPLRERIFFWKRFGGHLALIVGFEGNIENIKGFYVNHTSIIPDYNWQYKFIELEKFKAGFTGRCIIVKS
ncbi:MAG: hypothetical protein WCV69_01010 [Patescibacteria group bacterium]|jgi:hypothetical protein